MILRAPIFHTPRNPFRYDDALEVFPDGALLVENGRVAACGDYLEVRAQYPEADVRDMRDGVLLPGFVDAHIHFPQVRALGGIGYSLLGWLENITLPEEVKFGHPSYARAVAQEFLHSLAAHGTTTALVFGAHFAGATAALFEASAEKGLRVVSGLVLSDRLLRSDLLQKPETAYRDSRQLIESIRGKPRLGYAVIPRFALSASEPMLEVCRALLDENPELLFTTHINENIREIEEVSRQFPWAADY